MGVMCVVWRYRLAVSIIVVWVVCDVCASDGPQPIGKVYPRGNHWAVGHLMGKKSTDEQDRLEDPDGENFTAITDEYLQSDRDADPVLLRVLEALVRGKTGARRARDSAQQTDASHLLQRLIATGRHWQEGRERDRLKQGEELILQALAMKDKSS